MREIRASSSMRGCRKRATAQRACALLYQRPWLVSAGRAFVWMDRYLDAARQGPVWLKEPEIASIVAESIRFGASALNQYCLHAWVIMPNHVHLLVSPIPILPPPRFLKSVKGFTSREANQRLNRTGQPFWQHESYDHWVRTQEEFDKIRVYIENNPVRAGLARIAEEFRWSSAWRG